MATNNDPEIILFGAQYSNEGIVNFANSFLEGFEKIKAGQTKLNSTLQSTKAQIDAVANQMNANKSTIDNLNKSTIQYDETIAKLNADNKQLAKQNVELNASYQKQAEELAKVKKVADEVEKSVKKVGETQKKVSDLMKGPLMPVVDTQKIGEAATKLEQLKAAFDIKGTASFFDESELAQLDQRLEKTKGDFQLIGTVVDELSKKLLQLEPGTKEFQELSKVVTAGNKVLNEYKTQFTEATKVVDQSDPKFKSLRARLREVREELTKLEEAGQDETEQYVETQQAAARLTEQYDDMQQKIRILSQGEKYFNFGADAIQAAAAGYQVATGALELFGVSSENAEEAQRKLLAVLNLVQGIQQLRVALDEAGTLAVIGNKLATDAYAASNRILTVVLGETAAASKGLQAALITTGIGALVVAIGFLVTKIIEWTDATANAKDEQERLNKVLKDQQEILDGDIAIIERSTQIRNEKLKQRGLKEGAIFKSNQQGQLQILQVYNDRLAELSDAYDKADLSKRYLINEEIEKVAAARRKFIQDNELTVEEERTRIAEEGRKKAKEIRDKRIQDEKAANELLKEIRKELSLLFASEEKKELIEQEAAYAERRKVLVKGHKDTTLLDELFVKERQQIFSKYRKIRADEEEKIIEEIQALDIEANTKRIENIEDQFARETAAIRNEYNKQKNDLLVAQRAQLNALLEDRNKNVITPEQYSKFVDQINGVYDNLFIQLEANTDAKLRQVGANSFNAVLDGMERGLKNLVLQLDTVTVEQIQALAKKYTSGQISFEQYQKSLTEINKRENHQRLVDTIDSLDTEIGLIRSRLNSSLTETERKALQDRLMQLQQAQNDANRELATSEAQSLKERQDQRLKALDDYLGAYNEVTQAIVGLIQQVDAADQKRLERQISYQQKRVEYAKQIAEKGNAEYLELEQKRLDELENQKEAAAQKQIVINNALVASQALVAVISAIAQAASTGSPVAIAGAIAAVIGAISAGYEFVNSLNNPVPQFFTGVDRVPGPAGRDQVPAMLTRDERVVPVKDNMDYWQTLEAIRQRRISPEMLNSFVAGHSRERIPQIDSSRLAAATEAKFSFSMHETNSKLDRVAEILENLPASEFKMSMDQRGFSVSLIKELGRLKVISRS